MVTQFCKLYDELTREKALAYLTDKLLVIREEGYRVVRDPKPPFVAQIALHIRRRFLGSIPTIDLFFYRQDLGKW